MIYRKNLKDKDLKMKTLSSYKAKSDFYQQAYLAFKAMLSGLSSFNRLVMYEILPYCNYETGTVILPSLEELACNDFQVDVAPGRKKESINADTLRNTFRAIKKAKAGHFLFSVENQRIKIEIPFLRDLYQQYHHATDKVAAEDAGDVARGKTFATTEESVVLGQLVSGDLAPEDAAAVSLKPAEEGIVYILNKNKQNKHTRDDGGNYGKRLISPDFYPSDDTIQAALGEGLSKVLDTDEIQKFIWHNQEKNSQWPDFNPVFIWWLKREAEHRQHKATTTLITSSPKQHASRSKSNEQRSVNSISAFDKTMEQVRRDNPNPWNPASEWLDDEQTINLNISFERATYQLGVDGTNQHLRHAVYQ